MATMPEDTLWLMSSLQHSSAVSKSWKQKKSDSSGSDARACDDVDADGGDASDAADDAPVLDDVLCDDCVCGGAGVECAGVLLLWLSSVWVFSSVWKKALSALKQSLHNSAICRPERYG